MENLFTKNEKFKRLFECFLELAETDVQKDALEQIMKNGEYNGFKLNSMLSTKKYNDRSEIKRRLAFAEMILHDENLFFYLANNGLNIFHGTGIDALEPILNDGIMSSLDLYEKGIELKTGEQILQHRILDKYLGPSDNNPRRNFVSLTDDFNTAASYAHFYSDETIAYKLMYDGYDLRNAKDVPIITCFNGNDIKEKYGESVIPDHVLDGNGRSNNLSEILITSTIAPSDIKCVITSYDKIEQIKSIVSKYGINVLGFNKNDNYREGILKKEGKFYNPDWEIDEQEFERVKERKANRNDQNNIGENYSFNKIKNTQSLSEDVSMKVALNVKMDIVFDLTAKYNSGISFVPITAKDLIARYNISENVAQKLAADTNELLEGYIHSKEQQKENYTPYVLDGDDEDIASMGGRSR